MSSKFIQYLTALALMVTVNIAAHAASITLSPATATANVGEQIVFNIDMDFTGDPTLGGGFDILFDDILHFVSFEFNAALGDEAAFRRAPDVLVGTLAGIGFGSFGGLDGVRTIGELTLSGTTVGTATVSLAPTTTPAGPFVSATDFVSLQAIAFSGANVNLSAVPLPASVYLFGLACSLLAARKRK